MSSSKVLALGGAGAMGRAASRDLAASSDVSLTIADVDTDAARALAADLGGEIGVEAVDVTDAEELVSLLDGFDVVANALPYRFNVDVMEACLDAGAHYLDLGGLYHVTRDQLELDDAFREAELTAVLGMGASPGMTNVATAKGASHLDRVTEIHIRTGAAGGGEGFAYSAKTILDELTMEPVVYRDGDFETADALSGRETYEMPEPVGEVEGFHSIHSELATMPDSFDGVEQVDFRVAFSPDLVAICETLIDLGLTSDEPVEFRGAEFSPREFLDFHLDRQPAPGPTEEHKSFRVDVLGEEGGDEAHYRLSTVVSSRLDAWGLNATAVWTGVPLAAASAVVGRGDALASGALPPESALNPDVMIDELRGRGIEITERRVE